MQGGIRVAELERAVDLLFDLISQLDLFFGGNEVGTGAHTDGVPLKAKDVSLRNFFWRHSD